MGITQYLYHVTKISDACRVPETESPSWYGAIILEISHALKKRTKRVGNSAV